MHEETTAARTLARVAFVGALSYALTIVNPLSWGVFSFRVSGALRALYLTAPEVSFGVALASLISNYQTGKLLVGLYPVLALMNVPVAYVAAAAYRRARPLAYAVVPLAYATVATLNYALFARAPFWPVFAAKLASEAVVFAVGVALTRRMRG